ncbi:MAG: ATP-dependent Clp protease ATP-binding subunit [Patescibacteria group bacterium]
MRDPQDIFRHFNPQARKILTMSQQVADSMHSGIGSEHVLIGLALTGETLAFEILKEYAINLEQIRLVLALNKLITNQQAGMTDEAKMVINIAIKLAAQLKQDKIEAEHLLFAITSLRESRAYQLIARLGVNPEHIRRQLLTTLTQSADLWTIIEPYLEGSDHEFDGNHVGHIHPPDDEVHHHEDVLPIGTLSNFPKTREKKTKALEHFTVDLTEQARAGKLDPIIGRVAEITRAIQILARRTKNNPVLLGEPGVGKTAIVEALAQRISAGQVPPILNGRRILRLDLGLLVAGTMYRGQFEERLKKLMEEILADPQVILFIDELHTVVGTGSAEGSLDAANILKPALARGQLRIIGATTREDYRRSLEKDAAFERRFQPISVIEPSLLETQAILEGLKSTYEDFHRVRLDSHALTTAVRLAARYINDRYLPDKAIDVIDEAAAAKQLNEPNQDIIKQRRFEEDLIRLQEQKNRAIEREAFSQAALLREKETKIRTKLDQLQTKQAKTHRPLITETDVAAVVSRMTNIPIDYLVRSGIINPDDLRQRLNQRLIGQSQAVRQVVAAIHRAQAKLNLPNRPLGSFLFLGPTGVGKTELGRLLAKEVFGSHEAFQKIDMSEFMERHTVSRLVGAPAGYVGYEDGGKLTDIVRRRPHSLILFDEIEKAHPDFQHLLLQILEDGYLTDARGRKVSFAQTVIILTSNLGSDTLGQAQALGFRTITNQPTNLAQQNYHEASERVLASVRDYFRPEFLNRLDATIIFNPLNPDSISQIVKLRLAELANRLTEAGYYLLVKEPAISWISKRGFDQTFGARPIRRVISEYLENPLAELILTDQLKSGQTVDVKPAKDQSQLELTITKKGT